MRYKSDHKETTRRKIVESASREFRTHGLEGVGVANLMKVSGLTHGGFYAHFADKETLISETTVFALQERLAAMLEALELGGFPALLEMYLSQRHRDHPEFGCPLAALAAEMARHPEPTKDAFTMQLRTVFDALAEHMPAKTAKQRSSMASFVLTSMAGAVAVARAVSDEVLSQSILESTRTHLLRLGKEPQG
jgi:TetR/AcrR family transcriptional regulator, transcriptional repressor for nem operon